MPGVEVVDLDTICANILHSLFLHSTLAVLIHQRPLSAEICAEVAVCPKVMTARYHSLHPTVRMSFFTSHIPYRELSN